MNKIFSILLLGASFLSVSAMERHRIYPDGALLSLKDRVLIDFLTTITEQYDKLLQGKVPIQERLEKRHQCFLEGMKILARLPLELQELIIERLISQAERADIFAHELIYRSLKDKEQGVSYFKKFTLASRLHLLCYIATKMYVTAEINVLLEDLIEAVPCNTYEDIATVANFLRTFGYNSLEKKQLFFPKEMIVRTADVGSKLNDKINELLKGVVFGPAYQAAMPLIEKEKNEKQGFWAYLPERGAGAFKNLNFQPDECRRWDLPAHNIRFALLRWGCLSVQHTQAVQEGLSQAGYDYGQVFMFRQSKLLLKTLLTEYVHFRKLFPDIEKFAHLQLEKKLPVCAIFLSVRDTIAKLVCALLLHDDDARATFTKEFHEEIGEAAKMMLACLVSERVGKRMLRPLPDAEKIERLGRFIQFVLPLLLTDQEGLSLFFKNLQQLHYSVRIQQETDFFDMVRDLIKQHLPEKMSFLSPFIEGLPVAFIRGHDDISTASINDFEHNYLNLEGQEQLFQDAETAASDVSDNED